MLEDLKARLEAVDKTLESNGCPTCVVSVPTANDDVRERLAALLKEHAATAAFNIDVARCEHVPMPLQYASVVSDNTALLGEVAALHERVDTVIRSWSSPAGAASSRGNCASCTSHVPTPAAEGYFFLDVSNSLEQPASSGSREGDTRPARMPQNVVSSEVLVSPSFEKGQRGRHRHNTSIGRRRSASAEAIRNDAHSPVRANNRRTSVACSVVSQEGVSPARPPPRSPGGLLWGSFRHHARW